uniref:Putative ribonuclease H-like domain-containing protein n=1 Tax=Tanacetum cinerariifolium TaxID=118510 RepID=A0A699I210_TANCI|nr:putative ribonuclease H-like domain-containing protein [Tanacetum cinerariifolium]
MDLSLDRVSDNKDCSVESPVVVEKKTVVPTVTKVEFVRPKQQEKPVRKLVKYAEMYRSQGSRGNQRNWNNLKSQQLANCNYHQRERVVSENNFTKSHPQQVQEDQGYIDSGCFSHMTENMSYLSDFKEFNRGYVTFGGGANGGRITGKGTIYTASKDETLGILKKFITEIENLVDKKVKVIRCDNGTKFKNSVMNDFCAMKCIRREFSVARTPQQNGVIERRNRTLIEAARTMLADSKLPTTF